MLKMHVSLAHPIRWLWFSKIIIIIIIISFLSPLGVISMNERTYERRGRIEDDQTCVGNLWLPLACHLSPRTDERMNATGLFSTWQTSWHCMHAWMGNSPTLVVWNYRLRECQESSARAMHRHDRWQPLLGDRKSLKRWKNNLQAFCLVAKEDTTCERWLSENLTLG